MTTRNRSRNAGQTPMPKMAMARDPSQPVARDLGALVEAAQIEPAPEPTRDQLLQANLQLQLELQATREEKSYWANACMQARAQLQQLTANATATSPACSTD